jgi:hypothetical protein
MRPSTPLKTEGRGRRASMVRRSTVLLVGVALLMPASSSAEARTLRIRHDANDTGMKTDIRRVVSDLSTSTVYLRIDTWQKFHEGYFIVRFDAGGNPDYDRVLEIYSGRGRFTCLLERAAGGSTDPGKVVGDRRARRPAERSVACSLPRSWFPRIQRMVRFYVKSYGTKNDRAPDRWLYHWL